MTQITPDETKKIASLAKLELSHKEVEKYSKQLSNVINHINELSEIEIDNTEPTSQTTGLTNVLREDETDTASMLSQEEALSGTENTKNGYFVVDQIIQKEG